MKKFRFTAFNRLAGAILVFASILIISSSASAQSIADGSTPLALSPGAPAGSYSLSDFDSVNPYNGNLGFSLPLVKIGGRGGAGYAMGARIEQKWLVEKEPRPGQPTLYTPSPAWWNIEGFRPIFSMGRMDTRQAGSTDYIIACGSYIHRETLTRLTFTAPDGTEYELRDQLTNGRPDHPTCTTGFNRGKVFVTSDGSVATFISDTDISDYVDANSEPVNAPPSGYLTLRDGTHYRVDAGVVSWMRDRNGNKLIFTYDLSRRVTTITDSLNRQITVAYATQIPGYDQITLKGFGGATRTIKLYKAYLQNALRSDFSLQTFQQLFPELNGAYSISSNPPVISGIELPNGQQYQFKYNSYAELARVVLPTGGAIEYDYAAGLTDGAASGVLPNVYGGDKHVYRRVTERRIYPDGGSGAGYASRMTYSRPESSTSNAGYVVVDQYNSSGTLLGRSSHYFYGSARDSFNQQPTQYPGWKDGREYQTTVFAANGTTPLRQVTNTFAQRAAVSWWTGSADLAPSNDPRLTESIATLMDTNQVSKQTFGYDDSVPFNNQNNVKEYDFGSGAPGALLRETRTTFVTSSSYTGTDVSLLSLPLQTSVYDGAGVERARAIFEYDNYNTDANHAALLNRTGISGFDSSFSTSYLTRGNATATTRYLLVNGSVTGSITSYAQYDIAGNAVKAIDARGNAATLDYSDRFGSPDGEARSNSGASELAGQYSYAFPTLVTNALGHTAYTQFDYYLGRPVDGEDANGIVSSGYYNDALDRPTQMIRAANQGAGIKSQSTFSYDDANHIVTSTSDQSSYGDNLLKSQTVYDGLGRTTDKSQYESPTSSVTVRQTYDALGRAYQTSNPFRSGETVVWTTTAYDALSRVTSVTTPDSAVVNTSYSGSTVTVTDQAGKARKSVTDGLGRLIQVYEDPAVLNYLTSYSYDTLDNLTSVSQGSQTRSFVYDSLKRLTSATNPESGTINYQYDNNGNLLNKTDARSIVSTYVYDALNRATSRSYSDGTLTVSYFYDAQSLPSGAPSYSRGYSTGRLVALTYGASSSTGDYYGFDAAGRNTLKIQQTGTVNYQTSAAYSLAGAMTTETYPSGHTATYAYDQAGRTTSLSGNLGDGASRTYSTGIIYSSLGGMAKEQFGTTTPIYNKLFYNVRGQLAEIRESTSYTGPTDTTWDRGAIINHYSNTCWGMCSGHTMTDDNGNLQKQDVYNPDGTLFTQFYSYDSLNRLWKSKESLNGAPVNWQQQYSFDRYGNRTIDQANTYGTGIPKPNFGVDTNTNRLTAPAGSTMSYDAAGNLTFDNSDGIGGTRTYDAENKMKQAWANNQWQTYTYDGDGRRVKRSVNGTETWQVYGLGGELIAEYAASAAASSPQKEYGYRNGQLLITAEAGSGGGGSGPQNVTWTNAVGVTVSGNSLTKTAADGWTSGAASTQSIASGDGYVEFTATESTTYRMAGLSHGDSDQSFQDIDFAFYEAGGSLCIYEAGTSRGCFGAYASGDTLRVAVEGGVVKYKKNGTVVYTSTVAPSYPLLADTSLYSNGSTISSAVISTGASGGGGNQNASFTSAVGVSVNGNSLTKTAADGWGNAGAASTQSIASGDGYVEFTATESTTYRMLGLSHGDSDQSFQDIDFGLYVADGGTLYVWEAGVARGVVGYFATGDILRVAVESGVVKYRKNGTLLYTSTVAPTYPLLVDTALYSNGATLNNVVISGASGGGGSSIHWLVTDQLGTPRMVFDQSGSLSTVSRHDYLPFGEELFAGTGGRTQAQGYTLSDNVRQKFTQKERDSETGLDYSLARYYSSTQGRFTSVDPFDIVSESKATAETNPDKAIAQFMSYLGQPQNWNRYVYVRNNPLKYVDPTGELLELTGSDEDKKKAFERIKDLVGKDGAKYIEMKEMCASNGHCGTYVDYKEDFSGRAGLANSGGVNSFIGQIIDSDKTVEFRVATSFDTKFQSGVFTSSMNCGGGCTVGAEESLTGNTQIFVHPDAGNITQGQFNVQINDWKVDPRGHVLDFYNDIDDAHEFGHAYANAIEGLPIHNSSATYARSIQFEQLIRSQRYPGNHARRIHH